jgi:hypothetical protein
VRRRYSRGKGGNNSGGDTAEGIEGIGEEEILQKEGRE